ncbi:hypothetical protein ACTFIW_003413 [Dictyostelium discoideum]
MRQNFTDYQQQYTDKLVTHGFVQDIWMILKKWYKKNANTRVYIYFKFPYPYDDIHPVINQPLLYIGKSMVNVKFRPKAKRQKIYESIENQPVISCFMRLNANCYDEKGNSDAGHIEECLLMKFATLPNDVNSFRTGVDTLREIVEKNNSNMLSTSTTKQTIK